MTEAGFDSDKGRMRDHNEDSCLILPSQQIYVVADGVGGNNSGEYASRMAVSCVADFIREKDLSEAADFDQLCDLFKECVDEVNRAVFATAREFEESRGMATTLVICFIREDKAYFVNIGDSRAYIKRGGELIQVTQDHSYVNTLLKMGVITRDEAIGHERGNIITRAIGAEASVEADYYQQDLADGDVILLCTDGLHNEVSEEEMINIIDESGSMKELAPALVGKANEAGGKDNITVVCLRVRREAADEQ